MEDDMPEDWSILREWLPEDLDGLAREHGFIRRARGLQDAETWLRVLLMHVAGGLSLEQTALRARELGLADVSAVAVFKRLRAAGPWLEALTRSLLEKRTRDAGSVPDWLARVVVVDATDVQEPGSSGTDWRVHYRVRLGDLGCDHFELTDVHEGERLGRFDFGPRHIVLADRGYCHRAGAAHVLRTGAALVLRLHHAIFPLEDSRGAPLDLCAWCRELNKGEAGERAVWFRHDGRRHRLRLCALRKGKVATDRARKRQRQKASRMGTEQRPDSVELASYVLVLSSLPAKEWSATRVLELYRWRWQIELVFKRLKSLLGAGHVPKSEPASAKAWMQAKILTALLLERTLQEARFFSPWGFPLPTTLQSLAANPGGG